MTEEEAYNTALQELQGQHVVQGMWAKAMAFSEGDEKRAKANYLRFRAEQLLQKEGVFVAATKGMDVSTLLFSPNGRMARWLFAAVVGCAAFVIILGTVVIDSARYGNEGIATMLCFPFFALSAWSILAAHIKRARDTEISPYLVLLYLIPFLGWFFFFYFLFAPSFEATQEGIPTAEEEKNNQAQESTAPSGRGSS